jgi:hypothetical protein
MTEYNLVTDASKFEINGQFQVTTNDGLPAIRFAVGGGVWEDTLITNFPIEFVADCTDINLRGYWYQPAYVSVDGGAYTVLTAPGTSGVHTFLTGLGAGKHLIRIYTPDGFWNGFQLIGGAETIDTVATTKMVARGTALASRTVSGTSVAKTYGPWSITFGGEGGVTAGAYSSQEVDLQFTGTEVEAAVIGPTGHAAYEDPPVSPLVLPDGVNISTIVLSGASGYNCYAGLNSKTLTPGTHTLCCMSPEGGIKSIKGFRVFNGSRLSSATSIGATTVTVDDGTKFATGQWVRIDRDANQELRKITGVSGNVLTVAALSIAHAQYMRVCGWHHPAGSFAAFGPDRTALRYGAIGDSNTAGANTWSGGGGTLNRGPVGS